MPEPSPQAPISLLVTASPDPQRLPIGTLLSLQQVANLVQMTVPQLRMELHDADAIEFLNLRIEVIYDDPDEHDTSGSR